MTYIGKKCQNNTRNNLPEQKQFGWQFCIYLFCTVQFKDNKIINITWMDNKTRWIVMRRYISKLISTKKNHII
ncbi:hypothetical protein BLA29_009018 [Euroglyphus maynei]|uniref:Uncharacterized protein n=1 Tax=Euroglyphus maynei TaxID=6958 RepID=A0A1Y3BKS5_EURMA|nr:hypothetical protein BLA29_009018 [Euroglyphus maynei]